MNAGKEVDSRALDTAHGNVRSNDWESQDAGVSETQ